MTNASNTRPVTSAELAAHVAATQVLVTNILTRVHGVEFVETHGAVISLDKGGRKYARIVKADKNGSGRSVHHFVDLSTGNILKAASWKAPAKHARGNIRQEDLRRSLSSSGAAYMR